MNRIDNGGSAYPRTGFYPETASVHREDLSGVLDTRTEPQKGMTLREHFAGVALAGLLARKVTGPAADLAGQAYELADALIAARSKPATSEREKLLGVIADLSTEAATAASAMPDADLRGVLARISRSGNDAIREARGL